MSNPSQQTLQAARASRNGRTIQRFTGNHIIYGGAAAGSWLQAFKENSGLLIHCDPLSSGPLARCNTLAEWQSTRRAYLHETYSRWIGHDDRCTLRDLSCSAEKLKTHDQTYIWLSTSLDEQLMLLYCLFLLRTIGITEPSVRMLLFESRPGSHHKRHCMGSRSPEEIADPPAPITIEKEHLGYCARIWDIVTSATPRMLMDECNRTDSPIPAIPNALKYLLRRYPQKRSGLLYWDEILLKNVAKRGPKAAGIVGNIIAETIDENDLVGDLYLFSRLHHLANLPEPLITLAGSTGTFGGTTIELTRFGELVAQEKATSLKVNPLDEWIGGVHLSSEAGNLWLYDDGELVHAEKATSAHFR